MMFLQIQTNLGAGLNYPTIAGKCEMPAGEGFSDLNTMTSKR